MPLKSIVNVKCPCCSSVLEVDVTLERVVAWRRGSHLKDDARAGEDGLDVAMRNQRDTKHRAESDFLAAQDQLKHQSEHLEDLFRKAKEKAKDEKDDPSDPFKGKKIWD